MPALKPVAEIELGGDVADVRSAAHSDDGCCFRVDAVVSTEAVGALARDDEQERTSRLLLRDEWSSLQAPAYLPLPVWTKPSSQRDDF